MVGVVVIDRWESKGDMVRYNKISVAYLIVALYNFVIVVEDVYIQHNAGLPSNVSTPSRQ
jgi:hypothetical protein